MFSIIEGAVHLLEPFPTFFAKANAVVLGNNKSMFSLFNATGSTVKLKVREFYIINAQTTAVTGVITQFDITRFTTLHTAGTNITPVSADTSDTLSASITCKTGATVTGEETTPFMTWRFSSDEWGTGGSDVESMSQTAATSQPLYCKSDVMRKTITLNALEGLTIKCVTNTTNGSFDILVIFTQE